ncbi:MAG: hypothetical protein E4H14_12710 [Candidatus Thorarchaeota archaeon]|nr:MAG: hypothetical protein E4H14_12710 [Candidatus Thorarchaeota archaeon]
MGSIWFSKKSFFYFGGLAVILIGGLVVVSSPYHYINYSVSVNQQRPWTIYNAAGYYPQVEISISLRPSNTTVVLLDLVILDNDTLDTTSLNMTLGPEHQVIGPDVTIYEYSEIIDLAPGNYTVYFEKVDGAGNIDLGLNQISDSRIWIVSGGMMNIIGIVMGIAGYLVPGSFLPSDSDTIVEWGYDKEEKDQ